MCRAIDLAGEAQIAGEVPVGAVVVGADGALLGEGHNQPISAADPSAHAEIVALRAAASASGNYRLPGATLYVTLEPCLMCAGAMVHARLARLVFGADDPRAGAIRSVAAMLDAAWHNHRVAWQGGLEAQQCSQILRAFFRQRR